MKPNADPSKLNNKSYIELRKICYYAVQHMAMEQEVDLYPIDICEIVIDGIFIAQRDLLKKYPLDFVPPKGKQIWTDMKKEKYSPSKGANGY